MSRKSIEQIVSALQLAPYAPDHWMAALEGLADATNSRHAEMICWKQPKATPFKMISHLTDEQAAIIRDWEAHIGADPVVNPIIAKGISMPVLQALSDEEVIRIDERERHIVWNEFYFRVDMHHMCFTPLWRGGDSVLGLFLLRSRRDGPVKSNERRLFMQAARPWRESAMLARSLKEDGARVIAGALDTLSIRSAILDGIGRCMHLSPLVESLAVAGNLVSVRSQRLKLASAVKATAQCPLVGRQIRVDTDLQPCTDCAVHARRPCARNCAILVKDPNGRSTSLRISSLPGHHHEIPFGAAAIVVIDASPEDRGVALLPGVAAVLTTAEREVALELLRGRRPVEIARRRQVSIETIRSQVKHIYAKVECKSVMEFVARARQ